MKRLISFAAIIALTASFVSCNKEVITTPSDEGYTYRFSIVDDNTRATLDNQGVAWQASDRVGMFLDGYTGYANIDMESSPKEVILYSTEAIPANSYAYSYYPYNPSNKERTAESVVINLSSVQQGGSLSSMPMVGVPFLVETEAAAQSKPNGSIYFLNLGSIIDFKIYSSKYSGETVQYVTFKANDAIVAGDVTMNLKTVSKTDDSTLKLTWGSETSDNVKVNQEVSVADTKDAAESIYMVVAPGKYSGIITIGTDVATYTFNFTDKTLNRNAVKHYNMNLDNAEREAGVVVVEKIPPYEEPFTSNQGDFSIDNVSLPSGQSSIWSFDASYGAKVTAYINKVNYASESWLVSPIINLVDATSAELSFEQCVNKYLAAGDGSLQIKVAGSDSWTQLSNSYPTVGSNGWSSFEKFTVDLADYVGDKIVFAFKYISTSDGAGTWEIKNFKVTAQSATDPAIVAEDVANIPVIGGPFSTTYELVNFSEDDDIVATPDGTIVTEAKANDGTVTYTVAPNYSTSPKTGKITLSSASAGVSKEIAVSQVKSSGLKVSETTIVIPADQTTATFTVTTADFGWNAEVTALDGMNLSIDPTSGSAAEGEQTVTITSTASATNDAQDLGTILVYRNGNSSDTGKKTIAVKKAAVAVVGKYTLDGTITGGSSGYATDSEITQNEVSWKVMGNTTLSPWRIGGNSLTGVNRTIVSTTPIKFNVGKIEITHGAASSITVNSMTIIVASDGDFTTVVSTLTPEFVENGTVTATRPEGADWTNCYYKIVYNLTVSGTKNKFVEFKEATFTK
ncbi:MAG: choice-of-anchor J domain-containing protein [Bacteroidales bacterium]|nr:choice-of-anchor J domain-containing protein [Bacteroidales bacterium]